MQRETKQKISLWRLGLFIFGIVATVGVAVYALSKFAGDYIPFLAPVAPWIESAVSSAAAWFQANMLLALGAIGSAIAGIKGFFTLLGSVRKQGEETKAMVEEQVTATRATFENEIATVKAEKDNIIDGLNGQISTLSDEKKQLEANYENDMEIANQKITSLQTETDLKGKELEGLKRENERLAQFLDATGIKIRETVAGTQG